MRDLSSLSVHERLLLVQAEYGKTVLQAHGLERMLATLLICSAAFADGRQAPLEPEIDRIRKLPLGPLIERFSAQYPANDHLLEELDNLLFFRNELVHRISDTIVLAATDVEWEKKVIAELIEIRSYFNDVKPLLFPYMETFMQKLGVTDEQLRQLVSEVCPGLAHFVSSGA